MKLFKGYIKNIFLFFGYRITYTKKEPWGIDLYNDIGRLLNLDEIKVVFDVGANVGQSRDEYLEFFPQAKIYSFEPIKSSFKKLEETDPKNGRTFCLHVAMGEIPGKVQIPLQIKSTQNSLSKKRTEHTSPSMIFEEIEVETADRFVKENNVNGIDFLKIDTEGFEMEVLKGASEILHQKKAKFILLELGIKSHSRTTFFNEVQEYLSKHGYDVIGFYKQSQSLYTKSRFLMHSDVLFINSEWSKTLKPKFVKSFEFD